MCVYQAAQCRHAVSGSIADVSAPSLAVLCSNVFPITLPLLENSLCFLCLLLQLLLVLPCFCQLTLCSVTHKHMN